MNRKIKRTREYRDYYRKSKEQAKKHVCRISYINQKHLKKKNRFNERKYINKLHQRRLNKKITIIKCRKIINENENFSERNDKFHKYLQNKNINSRRRRARTRLDLNFFIRFRKYFKTSSLNYRE